MLLLAAAKRADPRRPRGARRRLGLAQPPRAGRALGQAAPDRRLRPQRAPSRAHGRGLRHGDPRLRSVPRSVTAGPTAPVAPAADLRRRPRLGGLRLGACAEGRRAGDRRGRARRDEAVRDPRQHRPRRRGRRGGADRRASGRAPGGRGPRRLRGRAAGAGQPPARDGSGGALAAHRRPDGRMRRAHGGLLGPERARLLRRPHRSGARGQWRPCRWQVQARPADRPDRHRLHGQDPCLRLRRGARASSTCPTRSCCTPSPTAPTISLPTPRRRWASPTGPATGARSSPIPRSTSSTSPRRTPCTRRWRSRPSPPASTSIARSRSPPSLRTPARWPRRRRPPGSRPRSASTTSATRCSASPAR